MKKIVWGVVIVVVIVLLVLFGGESKMEENNIKIGMIIPLTGPGGSLGEQIKNGIVLANKIENLNVVIEDSQTEPSKGISAYRKLVDLDKINMVVVAYSNIANAVIPLSAKEGVPSIQTVVSAKKVLPDNPDALRFFTSAQQEGPILAKISFENANAKTSAILYMNNEYGIAYKDEYINKFKELGGQIYSIESFESKDNDFRTQLSKIKSTRPDIVFIVGYDVHLVSAFQQVKEIGLESKLITNWILGSPHVQNLVGNNGENVYFTTTDFYLGNDKVTQFSDEYKKEFGVEPSAYSAVGYDLVKIIGKSIKGSKDVNDLLENISKLSDFPGVIGTLSSDNNGEISFNLYPAQIRNGKALLLEE